MVFRLGSNASGQAVDFRSDEIVVDLSAGRAGRGIAAAMKNAIQAGIRAIREPASQATLARRQEDAAGAAALWLSSGTGKRKRRARKHLTGGTYANATGNLADNMRVNQRDISGTEAVFTSDAPPDRLNKGDFAAGHRIKFKSHLLELVPALASGEALWHHPVVQKALERAIRSQTEIRKKTK